MAATRWKQVFLFWLFKEIMVPGAHLRMILRVPVPQRDPDHPFHSRKHGPGTAVGYRPVLVESANRQLKLVRYRHDCYRLSDPSVALASSSDSTMGNPGMEDKYLELFPGIVPVFFLHARHRYQFLPFVIIISRTLRLRSLFLLVHIQSNSCPSLKASIFLYSTIHLLQHPHHLQYEALTLRNPHRPGPVGSG